MYGIRQKFHNKLFKSKNYMKQKHVIFNELKNIKLDSNFNYLHLLSSLEF
jgi:hypothetical protein